MALPSIFLYKYVLLQSITLHLVARFRNLFSMNSKEEAFTDLMVE